MTTNSILEYIVTYFNILSALQIFIYSIRTKKQPYFLIGSSGVIRPIAGKANLTSD